MENSNPIHCNKDDKWYFWDECWVDEYGPYNTEQEAIDACNDYCKKVFKDS